MGNVIELAPIPKFSHMLTQILTLVSTFFSLNTSLFVFSKKFDLLTNNNLSYRHQKKIEIVCKIKFSKGTFKLHFQDLFFKLGFIGTRRNVVFISKHEQTRLKCLRTQ